MWTFTITIVYFAFIRSILEYCSSIWNSHYLVYIMQIESIQSKFVKYINHRTSYWQKDCLLSWNLHNILPLQNRRTVFDMLFLYNISSGNIDCADLSNFVLRLSAASRRTRQLRNRILRNSNKKSLILIYLTPKFSESYLVCNLHDVTN